MCNSIATFFRGGVPSQMYTRKMSLAVLRQKFAYRIRFLPQNLSEKRVNRLPVMISVCSEIYNSLKKQTAGAQANTPLCIRNPAQVLQEGIADTGCSTVCAGTDLIGKLGIKRSDLLESSMILRVADGRRLSVVGAIPVIRGTLVGFYYREGFSSPDVSHHKSHQTVPSPGK